MFREPESDQGDMQCGDGILPRALVIVTLMTMPPAALGQRTFSNGFEALDLPDIPPTSEPASARHSARPLGSTGAAQGYYEYLPPGYSFAQRYPLLIFVHGLGENGNGGSQLSLVLRNGPPRLIDRNTWDASRPFVVLSPQHTGGGCTTSNEIDAFIRFALAEYAINPDRVYLTGLSCGAIGSWNYAGSFINADIAAMVPIAGNGSGAFNRAGCDLGALPIWAFHGDADTVVGPSGTTTPINNLLACDPAPANVRMTIYPGVGHDSWARTYDLSAGHDIYSWMLQFRRP